VTGDAEELRIAPLPFADWSEEARELLLQHLRRPERYLSGSPDAPPMPVVLELFANHLALSQAWLPFTSMLAGTESRLQPVHRELLILRVAWRAHSGYEWHQHRRMAVAAGLTETQADAVPRWADADVWTPLERALLAAVDEMVEQFAVTQATWATLASHFAPGQLLELLFGLGGYLCLAAVLNSVGLDPVLPDVADDEPRP